MTALSRHLVFFGAAAALATVAWFAAVDPLRAWAARERTALSDAQERGARLIASVEELERQEATAASGGQFEGLWQAASVGEATAKVQASLSSMARRHGISLRTIAPLRAEPLPFAEALAFRIEAEARLDQLTAFLREAEYASPVLLFDNGTIRRLVKAGKQPEQPMVFFQFTITAAYDLGERGK